MEKITHARSDEKGNITNGVAGDQTGKEICTTDFYIHAKGWYVIRPKDPAVAEKIASTAEAVGANEHFGYDQNERDTGIAAAKAVNYVIEKVTKNVELDCSTLARLCCLSAGISVGDFYTGNERSTLNATGKFEKAVAYTSGMELKRGDILVTKTKGHTAIVTTGTVSTTAVSGWKQESGIWYYYKNGKKLKSSWVKSNHHWYRVGTDGKLLTGWHQIYDSEGVLRSCYFEEKNKDLLGAMWHEVPGGNGYLELWTVD